MKRLLMLLAVMMLWIATSASAAGPVKIQAGPTVINVEFYTPEIVRITKYPVGKEYQPQSLVVTASPENVTVNNNNGVISCGNITVKVDQKTGAITFLKGGKI
ncbi:MAG: DUF4968 domain-containing protein, partial [Bacteroidales bacterium]|nr:DUF4968 domain-containing protein [Bacteroidales bacterium]